MMEQLMGTVGTVGSTFSSYLGYAQQYAKPSNPTTSFVDEPRISTKKKKVMYYENHCPSCSKVLTVENHPRKLQCEHSFCNSCLDELAYEQMIICPECQEKTDLDINGIEGLEELQRNHFDDVDAPRGNSFLSKSFVDVDLRTSGNLVNPNLIEEEEEDEEEEIDAEDDFVVLSSKSLNVNPSCYVPFTQNKEICGTLVNHWLSTVWFTPCDLNETKTLQNFRALYVPFYVFRVQTETEYMVEIGKSKEENIPNSNWPVPLDWNKSDLVWNEVRGKIHGEYDELMTCATYSVNRLSVMSLLNKQMSFSFSTDKKLPPNPARFSKDTDLKETVLPIDIGKEEAFELAGKRKIFKGDEKSCKDQIKELYNPIATRNFDCKIRITEQSEYVILLPVYAGAFSYQNTEYEVVISGNRGVVEGNRPFGSGMLGKMVVDSWNTIKNVYHDTM